MNPSAPRLPWQIATVAHTHREAESACTIELTVPHWGGHLAGQHIDVKLTAEDGYSAQRSYSISRPADGERIAITVQRIADGEVSPYLSSLSAGDQIEVRGPIGGWFVWQPHDATAVLLIAGGSGIVPLMAMIRQRTVTGSATFRLIYSVRSPAEAIYAQELAELAQACSWLRLTMVHTRSAPPHDPRPPGRVGPGDLASGRRSIPAADARVFVCGPTGFVESVTTMLIERGCRPTSIRTERFGPGS